MHLSLSSSSSIFLSICLSFMGASFKGWNSLIATGKGWWITWCTVVPIEPMDAALRFLEEQMLDGTDIRYGLVAMAHPVSLRIPIVSPLASEFLGCTACWATIAIGIFNTGFVLGENRRCRNDQQNNYSWENLKIWIIVSIVG